MAAGLEGALERGRPRRMIEKQFPDVRSMVAALQPSYPVYCLRPLVLARAAQRFLELFPGRVLYDAGIRHFDTASLPEIALVSEGFADAGAYFMHPVKARAVIRTAARVYGVDTFVVDHIDELAKVLDETDGGEGVTIMVRIKTPQVEGTFYHLADKFGAEPADAAALLVEARSRGCQLGLAFHVGSQ